MGNNKKPLKLFKNRWLNVNGIKIHYLDGGKAEPFILLHGAGRKISGERAWNLNAGYFLNHYRVIVPDLAGFGLSDKPDVNYSFNYLSELSFKFIEILGFEKVILMGHSLGGAIAIWYSIKKPEKVKKLVIVNSAGLGKKITPLGRFLLKYFSLKARIEKEPVFLSIMKHGEVDLIRELKKVQVPTLIIWGNHDPYLPLKQAHRAHKLIKNSRLKIFRGCFHTPQKEKPEKFNRVVLKFLKDER